MNEMNKEPEMLSAKPLQTFEFSGCIFHIFHWYVVITVFPYLPELQVLLKLTMSATAT